MKRKMNEGIRKVQCYEFSDFLHRNFYYIQKGKKRTADVVKEYLESIGESNNKNAFDQLLKYAKAEVIKMQQASERSREGDWDSFLWESKKVKLSESRLKSIIKESIDKVLKEEVWGDPQSQERQLGDEYLRMTMDFCKSNGINLDGSTISTQLIPKLREVISIMLSAK